MAYRSLYLTYRPQTFEEVAGQQVIVRTLKNSLASGKIAHAFLFAGPRGTGKTTMARLLAKALNCEEGIGHQCCKCSNCLAIAEGSHPDVIEIDAASNNGVDQVRDLIEKVKYAPIKGHYKIYIIDEVHMMSTSAFNALLKTLEEPPENVIFILCTTEPYKVIPTIVSRCQRYDFTKLSPQDIKGKLIEVLTKEKSTYDEDGINAVISLADGGMRDALSILDQVLSYSGNTIHEKDVLTLYGLASKEEKISLVTSLINGDVSSVIKKSETFVKGGIDIRRLTGDIIAILKDLLIYLRTKDATLLDTLSLEEAKSLSTLINAEKLNIILDKLIATQNDYRNVNDIRSLFDVSLLEIASMATPSKSQPVETEVKPVVKEETKVQETKPVVEPQKEEPKPVPEVKEEPVKKVEEVKPAIEPIKEATPLVEATMPKAEEKPAQKMMETPSAVKPSKKMFDAPPDFLFEDEKPAAPVPPKSSIDSNRILKPAIAIDGPMNELADDELVKIMVLANKAERNKLTQSWDEFEALRGDPKLGNLATLLSEGRPFAISKEALVLCYDFKKLRDKANIVANQEPLEEMIEQILGRKVFIYALDPNERHHFIETFFNLQQVGKLPKKNEITLNLPTGKEEK